MSAAVWISEWSRVGPDREPALAGRALSVAARAEAEELRRRRLLAVTELRQGLQIETRSYVGTFALDDLVVHIQPKIPPDLTPTLMRYALGLRSVSVYRVSETPLHTRSFVDLVGLLLLEQVDVITAAGLFQDYRVTENWLSMPRGKLLFSELARSPVRTRLDAPCRYTRRTPDLPLNRLMLSAVGVMRREVADARLRMELHAREAMLGELCARQPLTWELLREAKTASDRRTAYYQPVLELAELILNAQGPGLSDGVRGLLRGFMFNMDLLFERFVARLCSEFAPPALVVDAQVSSSDAYRYRSNPHGWQRPRLRPDLVIRERETGAPTRVLDTKYKLLAGVPPSAADLYQLTLYSLSFGRSSFVPAAIVYPAVGSEVAIPTLDFCGFQQGAPIASVSLKPLDLAACTEALRKRDQRALSELVRGLVSDATGLVQ